MGCLKRRDQNMPTGGVCMSMKEKVCYQRVRACHPVWAYHAAGSNRACQEVGKCMSTEEKSHEIILGDMPVEFLNNSSVTIFYMLVSA
jgi:hypothetical protein